MDALPQLGVYSIDGRLQLENATTAIDDGRMADVPLLIGWTDFDGSSLRGGSPEDVVSGASDKLLAAYASEGLSGADLGYQMYTDSHVGAPASMDRPPGVEWRSELSLPFLLCPHAEPSEGSRGRPRRRYVFLFDAWDLVNPQLQLTEEDRTVSRILRSCWVSFAKTGAPRCEGAPEWPRYTPTR